jgi:hypothetical protein
MKLPPFEKMQENYPISSDVTAVRREIGGDVDAQWIENTCVLRISRAFNYSGHKKWLIPRNLEGLLTVVGADKLNYALRVQEFSDFLRDYYGSPDLVRSGANITVDPYMNVTGIIAWRVKGWADSNGHFTLWDGAKGLYEGAHRYFDFPTEKPDGGGAWLTKVELWRC